MDGCVICVRVYLLNWCICEFVHVLVGNTNSVSLLLGHEHGAAAASPLSGYQISDNFASSIDTYICVHTHTGVFHRASYRSTAFLPIELK